jgi:hypothetical protein
VSTTNFSVASRDGCVGGLVTFAFRLRGVGHVSALHLTKALIRSRKRFQLQISPARIEHLPRAGFCYRFHRHTPSHGCVSARSSRLRRPRHNARWAWYSVYQRGSKPDRPTQQRRKPASPAGFLPAALTKVAAGITHDGRRRVRLAVGSRATRRHRASVSTIRDSPRLLRAVSRGGCVKLWRDNVDRGCRAGRAGAISWERLDAACARRQPRSRFVCSSERIQARGGR